MCNGESLNLGRPRDPRTGVDVTCSVSIESDLSESPGSSSSEPTPRPEGPLSRSLSAASLTGVPDVLERQDSLPPPAPSSVASPDVDPVRSRSWTKSRPSSSGKSSRSSVDMLKRRTPRIDPCGTPPNTGLAVDQASPTRTVITLFDKKVANNAMVWLLAPFLAKDRRQC